MYKFIKMESLILRLAEGFDPFTFPNEEQFGEYRGKEVTVSYSFNEQGEATVMEESRTKKPLPEVAKNYVIAQLEPIIKLIR